MKNWTVSDIENAKYLGILETEGGNFEIFSTPARLIFGGFCNAGFLESGFMEREEGESVDCALQELIEEINTFYLDGAKFCNRIICNERM